MIVTITLTTAGADTGPFNLYSDVDGFISAFETGVSKASLLAGYTSSLVPNGTTTIRVMSASALCTNYIDIVISGECPTTTSTTTVLPTTTTTTIPATTTTSTTTVIPPTTTTTTVTPVSCTTYDIQPDPIAGTVSIEYFDCLGNLTTATYPEQANICAETGTVVITGGAGTVTAVGPC